MLPRTPVGSRQLSTLSWSRLQLPHSRVCPLLWTSSIQCLKDAYAFISPALSPQLCRAIRLQSSPWHWLNKALLQLQPCPASPHAQSCFPYRRGSQSALQYTTCADPLSSSPLPQEPDSAHKELTENNLSWESPDLLSQIRQPVLTPQKFLVVYFKNCFTGFWKIISY